MARLRRVCLPGVPQHVIQRGNNRQACFSGEEDFAAYAHWLEEYSSGCAVAIHAWVFMTNHVHLLVTPAERGGVSDMMQSLGRRYVRYFNHCYKRFGTLWEGSNGMGKSARLWTPHEIYLGLGNTPQTRASAYRALFGGHIEDSMLIEIREAVNQRMALGNDRFKEEVAELAGRRVKVIKKGRKPRNKERRRTERNSQFSSDSNYLCARHGHDLMGCKSPVHFPGGGQFDNFKKH